MSRFGSGGRMKVRRVRGCGNLRAYLDFSDRATGLSYRNFKLLDSEHGLFVASPALPNRRNGKYLDLICPKTAEGKKWFDELREAAIKAYEQSPHTPGANVNGRQAPVGRNVTLRRNGVRHIGAPRT